MMFSTLMELQKLHPPEDEILNQYLVPAICKAAAVLGMVCVCVCVSLYLFPGKLCSLLPFVACALLLNTLPGQSHRRACVPPAGDDPSQHPFAQPHGSPAWALVCVGVRSAG